MRQTIAHLVAQPFSVGTNTCYGLQRNIRIANFTTHMSFQITAHGVLRVFFQKSSNVRGAAINYALGFDRRTIDPSLLQETNQELNDLGLRAASVTSTLNRLRKTGAIKVPREILSFLPGDPKLIKNFSRLADCDIDFSNFDHHAKKLMDQLRVGRQLLTRQNHRDHAFLTHLEMDQLVHAWQSAVALTLLVMFDLDQINLVSGGSTDQPSRADLQRTLMEARDGGISLAVNGEYPLSAWSEKRASRRYMVNFMAEMTKNGTRQSVLVIDAAVGGLGIDFAKGINVGDAVSITIPPGRLLSGSIAWTAGTRAGITFFRKLKETDILFCGDSLD